MTTVYSAVASIGGIGPIYGVFDDLYNFLVIIRGIAFVTGLEIEDSAKLAGVAAARTEDLSALVGGDENYLVGVGDSERLAIDFLMLEIYKVADALSNGMSRLYLPNPFKVVVTAPEKVALGAHKELKRLTVMCRMKGDKAHSAPYMAADPFGVFFGNFLMRHMSPPDKYVGIVEQ